MVVKNNIKLDDDDKPKLRGTPHGWLWTNGMVKKIGFIKNVI